MFKHCLAALALAVPLTVAVGFAAPEITASADIGEEGSPDDTQNLLNATARDADASATLFTAPETGGTIPGIAASSYCQGAMSMPYAEGNASSPTDEDITMAYGIQCYGYNYVDITFYIERDRWWGVQTLKSHRVNDSGTNDTYRDYVSTYCRAGTWSYRSRATGYASGSSHQNVQAISKSFRHTCYNPDDLTYIDQS